MFLEKYPRSYWAAFKVFVMLRLFRSLTVYDQADVIAKLERRKHQQGDGE